MRERQAVRMAAMSVAAIAALALLSGAATGAALPRQFGSITFTASGPGKATGFVLDLHFRNPENPKVKPHTVTTMVVRTPVAGLIDTTVPPQCHASDAQLMLEGPAGCPAASKVGSGLAISDTGGGGPFPRYSEATISNFNNRNEIIGVGQVKSIPLLKPVDHTKIHGRTSTTHFPIFPGVPPPDPYTPFKSLHVVFPRYMHHGRPYMRTPPRCPAVGHWTITAEFTYADGVKQSLVSHSPCHSVHAPRRKNDRRDVPRISN